MVILPMLDFYYHILVQILQWETYCHIIRSYSLFSLNMVILIFSWIVYELVLNYTQDQMELAFSEEDKAFGFLVLGKMPA